MILATVLATVALASPTLSVAPNPATPYEPVTITGCGYSTSVWLTINNGVGFGEQPVDASGCFEMHWWAGPSDETYRAYGNARHRGKPLAATTLAVSVP